MLKTTTKLYTTAGEGPVPRSEYQNAFSVALHFQAAPEHREQRQPPTTRIPCPARVAASNGQHVPPLRLRRQEQDMLKRGFPVSFARGLCIFCILCHCPGVEKRSAFMGGRTNAKAISDTHRVAMKKLVLGYFVLLILKEIVYCINHFSFCVLHIHSWSMCKEHSRVWFVFLLENSKEIKHYIFVWIIWSTEPKLEGQITHQYHCYFFFNSQDRNNEVEYASPSGNSSSFNPTIDWSTPRISFRESLCKEKEMKCLNTFNLHLVQTYVYSTYTVSSAWMWLGR